MPSGMLALCGRFVPYDQWIVTHVDPAWQIHSLKLWLIAKCLAPNLLPRPATPPSPITFAVPQSQPAVSPILFSVPDSLDDTALDDDDIGHIDDTVPLVKPVTPEPAARPPPSLTSLSSIQPFPSIYKPDSLILVRFSTGQVLEDHFTAQWYDIRPYELLEIHRLGFIPPLPRHRIHDYVTPYWEGPVKSLRVVFRKLSQPTDPHKRQKPSTTTINTEIPSRKSSTLEWRERYILVRDGYFLMSKSRNVAPSQKIPLASLLALRGADHLSRSTAITPTSNQRIICAKFRVTRSITPPSPVTAPAPPPPPLVRSSSTASYRVANPSPLRDTTQKSRVKLRMKGSHTLSVSSKGKAKSGKSKSKSSQSPGQRQHPYSDGESDPTAETTDDDSTNDVDNEGREADLQPSENTPIPLRSMPLKAALEDISMQDSGEALSDSSSLSSPVFASTRLAGLGADDSDTLDSDNDIVKPGYSQGYRYGYQMMPKGDSKTSTTLAFSQVAPSIKDETKAFKEDKKLGTFETSEWVVLDMGDDCAYTSILRILHRHFPPPISSSFVHALPALQLDSPSQDGESRSIPVDDSPPPSPRFQYEIPNLTLQDTSKPMLHRLPMSLSDPSKRETNRPSRPRIMTSSLGTVTPQHPSALAPSHQPSFDDTFGALPYPEWRTSLVYKAQRAGVGEVGQPMEWVLFPERQLEGETSSIIELEHMGMDPADVSSRRAWKRESRAKSHRFSFASGTSTVTASAVNQSSSLTSATEETQPSLALGASPISFSSSGGESHIASTLNVMPRTPEQYNYSSGEESSEAEWVGWIGDLPRQNRMRRTEHKRRKTYSQAPHVDAEWESSSTPNVTVTTSSLPFISSSQIDNHRRLQEERKALEPTATVVSALTPASASGVERAAAVSSNSSAAGHSAQQLVALSSPSSVESLRHQKRNRALSVGFSPVDSPSSATSTSGSQSHSHSPLQESWKSHVHASSNTWPSRVGELPDDDQHFLSVPSSPRLSSSDTPNVLTSSSSNPLLKKSAHSSLPRRASIAGVMQGSSVTGSTVHSSSLSTRGPGLLRKNGPVANLKEKGKERRPRGKGAEAEPERKPRLSLSTGTGLPQTQGRQPESPTAIMETRARSPTLSNIVRRVKSGSSLLSGDDSNATQSSLPVPPVAVAASAVNVKKKRAGLVKGVSARAEKVVRRLDSALDFVDVREDTC